MTEQERHMMQAELRRLRAGAAALEAMMTAPMFKQWTVSAQAQHTSRLMTLTTQIAAMESDLASEPPSDRPSDPAA